MKPLSELSKKELSKIKMVVFDVDGVLRSAAGYPFSTTFKPVTGRLGYTWEALPGMTFYSQYATAADPTVANIFNLRPTTPLLLTTSRIYETGLKLLSSDKKAEFTVSAFDIERKNVYVPESGILFNVAGKIASKGFEAAATVLPPLNFHSMLSPGSASALAGRGNFAPATKLLMPDDSTTGSLFASRTRT